MTFAWNGWHAACICILLKALLFSTAAFPQPYSFAPPVLNPYGIVEHSGPERVSNILAADIDQDGALEAFVEIHQAQAGGEQDFLYYENTGSNHIPVFSLRQSYPFRIANEPGIWPRQFVDINGDGLPDLFFWEWAGGARVRLQLNAGNPHNPKFDAQGIIENPYGIVLPKTPLQTDHLLDAVTPTFVDIDSDGDFDLFYGGAFFNNEPDVGYYFARNNDPSGRGANPRFGLPERNPFGLVLPVAGYHRQAFADLDCDGDFDLFTYIENAGLFFHENAGSPANPLFGEGRLFFSLSESSAMKFDPASGIFLDIHGDADLDLICGGALGAYFFENRAEQQDANCLSTAVEERPSAGPLGIYPNPAGEGAWVEWEAETGQETPELAIYRLTGQLVFRETLRAQAYRVKEWISLEGMAPGVYTVVLRSGERWESRKLVKW